jgi:metallophosphoesterase (TIGR00282 family)
MKSASGSSRPELRVKILFIGDIVGRPGRDLVRRGLTSIVDHHHIDFVVANVENAAAGFGLTREIGETLLGQGIEVMTSGNHIWDKKEVLDYIELEPRLLRPANYPSGVPGQGSIVARTSIGERVAVLNLMGRVFMTPVDNPFTFATPVVTRLRERARIVVVDFHAEATSEKVAMGWHLDGHVTAVIGTHTHVQTADEQVLPGGTAYITDVGMTGPHDSIIGMEKEPSLARFLTGLPTRFEAATGNPRLNAVVITADPADGRASAIERLSLSLRDIEALSGRAAAVPTT